MSLDNSITTDTITGFLDHTIFRNDTNGYTVLMLDTNVTVVGFFPTLDDGDHLRFEGYFTEHATYGKQFKAQRYEIVPPQDTDSIIFYLSSGAIKGIGPALARRIVNKFGENTLKIIETEPERLAEIKGISERKARDIALVVFEKNKERNAIMFLFQYGIKDSLAMKILAHFGENVYEVLKTNPYQIAEEIKGVGFKTVDEIALKQGVALDSEHRIKSGIMYALSQGIVAGHTYLPQEILYSECQKLLGVFESSIDNGLMYLAIEKKIMIVEDKIWLYFYYVMEQKAAKILRELDVRFDSDEKAIKSFVEESCKENNLILDEQQQAAVLEAGCRGITVITGGPGTGKTTIITTIIRYFESLGKKISLAAPTGRAAKRMTESTKRPALTIHRLLEVSGGIDNNDDGPSKIMFGRNEEKPLDADVIILDEMSMVDMFLFYSLLMATPLNTRVILVGDANQLPSVGAGNVLRDIIDSNCFTVVRLTNIFRQNEASDIVINAHKIQKGERVYINNEETKDFFFLEYDNAGKLARDMLQVVKVKMPNYVNAGSFDIQVLSPSRQGNLGVVNLNTFLQKYLNPPDSKKDEYERGNTTYRVGDKVMQIKNDYSLDWRVEDDKHNIIEEGDGIYNGDIGRIISINSFAKIMTVLFDDDKIVDYSFNQLDELEHAFAMTVHKSQGSEYPAVVIPLMNTPYMLINRNLIYTAVTRAKKCVVLMGDKKIFHAMIENDMALNRYSGYREALESIG